MAEELPALIRDGYSSLKLFMTYPLLRLDDGQMLDLLSSRAPRAGDDLGARRERRHDRLGLAPPAGARPQRAQIPRDQPPTRRRGRGGRPPDRHGGAGRPADRGVPRHHRSGDGGDPRRADAGPEGVRRDVPAVPAAGGGRPRQAGTRGREVDVQPAGARRRGSRGDVAGRAERHFPDRLVRSRAIPLRSKRQARQGARTPISSRSRTAFPASSCVCRSCSPKASRKGRIGLERFVELCCTNPAKIYGLHPKKGTIAIGSDADLAIWDPEKKVEITDATTHDAAGYCPYAGMTVTGWPITVISRGEVIVDGGELLAERGRGRFLPRAAGEAAAARWPARPRDGPGAQLRRPSARLSGAVPIRAMSRWQSAESPDGWCGHDH